MRGPIGLVLGCLALAMAACQEPGTMTDDGGRLSDLKLVPSAIPNSKAPSVDPKAELDLLRSSVSQAYARTQEIHAQITGYIKNLESGETFSDKMEYWFQKPTSTALLVNECSQSKAVGTKMVWMGGDKVSVRTKFIGFWINVDLDETDDRIKDVRGDRISETSVPRMVSTFLDPAAQISIADHAQYRGRAVVRVVLKSHFMLSRVTSERFTIDQQSFLPVIREMFENNQLTYRIQLEDVQLNKLDPSAFKLDS